MSGVVKTKRQRERRTTTTKRREASSTTMTSAIRISRTTTCHTTALLLLLLLLLFSFENLTVTTAKPITAIADLSCNVLQDTCPTQYNGKCEATGDKSCNLDCGDCDLCTAYDYDCTACLQQGCYYCPGDAKCYNSNRYQYTTKIASCTSLSAYLHDGDSCEHVDQGRVFTDPEYMGQAWVYDMIEIAQVWKQGILGEGVRVRINDNGIDATHPEFAGRFDVDASCENYSYRSNPEESASHGTSVAGILAAASNNGVCSVGIAPKVTLSSCYVFDGPQYLLHALDKHDISQNSYGVDGCLARTTTRRNYRQLEPLDDQCPFSVSTSPSYPCTFCTSQDFVVATETTTTPSATCQRAIRQHCQAYFKEDQPGCLDFLEVLLGGNNCLYDTLSPYERQAFTKGILEGRNGKGIIYVFASGNAFTRGDDTNLQAYTNTRFLISVGAVGKDRLHASYSTPGASLFLVAPGGDSESVSNHITTSINGQCTNAGVGTSFACPVVSGVVALMLQVRPDLTWRDVQYILATTSQTVENDPLDTTAQRNAAGYWHSHWYGFGIVHAANAVELAESWTLVGPEQMLLAETGPLNLPIVDDESVFLETSVTLQVPTDTTFRTESVVVQLDIESFARGHLEIILTSPQGTSSILHPGERPENTQLEEKWKLLTVRNWGEDPSGEWTLTIVDLKKGDAGECASDPWEVQVGEQFVDCNFLERVGLCVEGLGPDPSGSLSAPLYAAVFQTRDNGLLAQDACCACGGGLSREEVSDQLVQWTLVVYGQEEEVSVTPRIVTTSPTTPPTPLPTRLPTSSPTSNPTPSPTQTPTSPPTTASPTSLPTMIPTSWPSHAPTEVPSASPSNTMTSMAPGTDLPSLSQSMSPSEMPLTATVSPLVKDIVPTDTSKTPSSTPTHSSFPPTSIAASTTPSMSQSIHPTSHHPSTDPTSMATVLPTDNYLTHVPSTLASFASTTAKPSFLPSATTTRANDDPTAMPTVVPQPLTSPPTTMPSMDDSTVSTLDPTISTSTTTAAPSSLTSTTTTTTAPPSLTSSKPPSTSGPMPTLLPSTTTSPTTTQTTTDTPTGTVILTPPPTPSPSSMPLPFSSLSTQMPSTTDATTTESTSTTTQDDEGEDRTTTILPPIEENETPPPSSTSPFPTGSRAPSVVPTRVPSQEPTMTTRTTPEPSVYPSFMPTTSRLPSMGPSVSPSLRPTTTKPSVTTTTSPTTIITSDDTLSPPASIARSTNVDSRNTSSSGRAARPRNCLCLGLFSTMTIVMTIMMMMMMSG